MARNQEFMIVLKHLLGGIKNLPGLDEISRTSLRIELGKCTTSAELNFFAKLHKLNVPPSDLQVASTSLSHFPNYRKDLREMIRVLAHKFEHYIGARAILTLYERVLRITDIYGYSSLLDDIAHLEQTRTDYIDFDDDECETEISLAEYPVSGLDNRVITNISPKPVHTIDPQVDTKKTESATESANLEAIITRYDMAISFSACSSVADITDKTIAALPGYGLGDAVIGRSDATLAQVEPVAQPEWNDKRLPMPPQKFTSLQILLTGTAVYKETTAIPGRDPLLMDSVAPDTHIFKRATGPFSDSQILNSPEFPPRLNTYYNSTHIATADKPPAPNLLPELLATDERSPTSVLDFLRDRPHARAKHKVLPIDTMWPSCHWMIA